MSRLAAVEPWRHDLDHHTVPQCTTVSCLQTELARWCAWEQLRTTHTIRIAKKNVSESRKGYGILYCAFYAVLSTPTCAYLIYIKCWQNYAGVHNNNHLTWQHAWPVQRQQLMPSGSQAWNVSLVSRRLIGNMIQHVLTRFIALDLRSQWVNIKKLSLCVATLSSKSNFSPSINLKLRKILYP